MNAGSAFNVSIQLPKEAVLPDTDLCAIVSNLLENAVEACTRMSSQDRFIRLKISSTTKFLLAIIIENSYEGKILRSGNIFISSKKGGGVKELAFPQCLISLKNIMEYQYLNIKISSSRYQYC